MLIPKSGKGTIYKRLLQANLPSEHSCKNPPQNTRKQIQQKSKQIIRHGQAGVILGKEV
jgi:hypothetical protein